MAKDEAKVMVREANFVGPTPTGFQSTEAAIAAEDDDTMDEAPPGMRLAVVQMKPREARDVGGSQRDPHKLVAVRVVKPLPRMIVAGEMYSLEAGRTYHIPRHVRDLLTEKGYC